MENILDKMPEYIADEAKDAMKYANLALELQADHSDLADMFLQISAEELHHMRMISDKIAGMVGKLHDKYNAK